MVSSVMSALILLKILYVALHKSGTRNALLGPWLNNTEVYLIPFIIVLIIIFQILEILEYQCHTEPTYRR